MGTGAIAVMRARSVWLLGSRKRNRLQESLQGITRCYDENH